MAANDDMRRLNAQRAAMRNARSIVDEVRSSKATIHTTSCDRLGNGSSARSRYESVILPRVERIKNYISLSHSRRSVSFCGEGGIRFPLMNTYHIDLDIDGRRHLDVKTVICDDRDTIRQAAFEVLSGVALDRLPEVRGRRSATAAARDVAGNYVCSAQISLGLQWIE